VEPTKTSLVSTFPKAETREVFEKALQESDRSFTGKVRRSFKKLLNVSSETLRAGMIVLREFEKPSPRTSLSLTERLKPYDKSGILTKKHPTRKNRSLIRPESGKIVGGKNLKLPTKNDFGARLENQEILSSLPSSERQKLEIQTAQIPQDAEVLSEQPSSSSSDLKKEMNGLPSKKTKSARKQDQRSRIFVEGFPVASSVSQLKRGKLPLKDNSVNLLPTFTQCSKIEEPGTLIPSISPSTRLAPKQKETAKSKEVSINKVFSKTQAERKFVINGKVDISAGYQEVLRRADQLGVKNFESRCSPERFTALATECDKVNGGSIKEAVTILQGEMEGYYKDSTRLDYRKDKNGPEVRAPDFAVKGRGKYRHITHADAKNIVGSGILKASNQTPDVSLAAEIVGQRALKQKNFWSNMTALDEASKKKDVQNVNFDLLPEFPNSTVAVLDSFDVPPYEKRLGINGFDIGTGNDNTTIYLNAILNI